MATPANARKKVRIMQAIVVDEYYETPDTKTLVLFTGNDKLEYKAGQFITIATQQFPALQRFVEYFEDTKGKKESPRAYSLASAPFEDHLIVTIKEAQYWSGESKYPPILSPYLTHRVKVGQRIQIKGITGPYFLADDIEEKTDHIVHVCAGSGIVPNFGIIKQAIHDNLNVKHTLLYTNKLPQDIIYRREFKELCQQHPDKLSMVNFFTRTDSHPGMVENTRYERIGTKHLQEFVPDIHKAMYYICGAGITPHERKACKEEGTVPRPKFLEDMLSHLAKLGVDKSQIFKESW